MYTTRRQTSIERHDIYDPKQSHVLVASLRGHAHTSPEKKSEKTPQRQGPKHNHQKDVFAFGLPPCAYRSYRHRTSRAQHCWGNVPYVHCLEGSTGLTLSSTSKRNEETLALNSFEQKRSSEVVT